MIPPIVAEVDQESTILAMPREPIPFNRPAITGREQRYVDRVFAKGKFAGGGSFTSSCNGWLQRYGGVPLALVTSSGTAAIEMAAILCDLSIGDEVILPSFGFPSLATAFVRCGARLVFVDIDPVTFNIDPEAVAEAVTARTKVIAVIHYAGVACEMEAIMRIAQAHGLRVVEDAAHALGSKIGSTACGSIGDFGCLSFHETKNIHCGEGGALYVRDRDHVERAEIVWEKGTDRRQYFRGVRDKYTWQDLGSSFILGELSAAFLLAQLEHLDEITRDRLRVWNAYRELLTPLAAREHIQIPDEISTTHNGHIFWVRTHNAEDRDDLIAYMESKSIHPVFHYSPLHLSKAGQRYGRFSGEDRNTSKVAETIVRLPLFYRFNEMNSVAEVISTFYE